MDTLRTAREVIGKIVILREGTEGSGRFSLWKARKPVPPVRVYTVPAVRIDRPRASVSSITLKPSEKKCIWYR